MRGEQGNGLPPGGANGPGGIYFQPLARSAQDLPRGNRSPFSLSCFWAWLRRAELGSSVSPGAAQVCLAWRAGRAPRLRRRAEVASMGCGTKEGIHELSEPVSFSRSTVGTLLRADCPSGGEFPRVSMADVVEQVLLGLWVGEAAFREATRAGAGSIAHRMLTEPQQDSARPAATLGDLGPAAGTPGTSCSPTLLVERAADRGRNDMLLQEERRHGQNSAVPLRSWLGASGIPAAAAAAPGDASARAAAPSGRDAAPFPPPARQGRGELQQQKCALPLG